jgi:tetratricopeptide (TPR) repeat protein
MQFSDARLAVLATPQSYDRGLRYALDGRVEITAQSDDAVSATVRGTAPYRVELRVGDSTRPWSCSCPIGTGGEFCKHCVAVAAVVGGSLSLTPTDGRSTGLGRLEEATAPADDGEAIAAYLGSRTSGQLIDIITGYVDEDDRLRQRLADAARLALGDEPDVKEWKKRVTRAFGRGFVDYRRAPAWAADVLDMVTAIDELADAGHPEAAAILAEHAHHRCETAVSRVDDSAGWITDIFSRLRAIHIKACAQGPFTPKALARRLVKLELNAELDTFHRSAVSHADSLGEEGLAEYGRLVDAAYGELPPDAGRSGPRFRIRQARIAHAIASKDPDRLIEVQSDAMRLPDDYIELADCLVATGRVDEALDWTERGLTAPADRFHQVPPLRAKRAELLRAAGRSEDVDDMYRQAFEARPTLSAFQEYLANVADPEQAKAYGVELVTVALGPGGEPMIGRAAETPQAVYAASILLAAGRPDEAWEVALTHGASHQDWLHLANLRAETAPEDTIAVLALDVEHHIESKKRSGYRRAAEQLGRIRQVAHGAGRDELYRQVLADVRSRHQRKTSLMALLDPME